MGWARGDEMRPESRFKKQVPQLLLSKTNPWASFLVLLLQFLTAARLGETVGFDGHETVFSL